MGDRSNTARHVLTRQVLPPQRPTNGIGIMIVAATAMFFAVASSAFLLRARMAADTGCPATYRAPVRATLTAAPPPRTCDKPVYKEVAPGHTVVSYSCPPDLVYRWPHVPAAAAIPADFAK